MFVHVHGTCPNITMTFSMFEDAYLTWNNTGNTIKDNHKKDQPQELCFRFYFMFASPDLQKTVHFPLTPQF